MVLIFWLFLYPNDHGNFKWPIIAFILSLSLAFLMGLSDDAYNTNPTIKFLTQLSCGTILVLSGIYFDFFKIQLLNYFITVFFLVFIMNGLNLLDNMDGISGSLSLVITLNLLCYHLLLNQPFPLLTFVLVGNISTLLVFLLYNIYPSKLYMGDSGSQLQGILLGASAVILFSPFSSGLYFPQISYQFIMLALIFLIPIVDVVTVFSQRILRGTSPFIGGKDHTNHALFILGLSENKILLLYVSIQLVACTLSVSFIFFSSPLLVISALLYCFAIFAFLFYITFKANPIHKS
ncbi:MAG: undecaprenyl/decaprenyl-phosphate alpha-N-acetylglucosaminyl 1-phosphate transferase [Bacteroidia bacterium]|nr:undecaprenyl/decaprenyl-phosphate alpha-N-acetylglucosaminyl 1-phosphate transferase [Bacteroidia bacterium]